MKITNPLQFTEHHRFYIFRDFSLGTLEEKVLGEMYQPMTGALAVALYRLLCQQLPAEQIGYSPLEQHRKLFLALGITPGASGRKQLIECTSRLEAVGLLQSLCKYNPENDETLYEYRLQAPLRPYEFFQNHHLTLLLRDKLGQHAVLHLYEMFCSREPQELTATALNEEDVSVPFYELFRLSSSAVDREFEQSLAEMAPAKEAVSPWSKENDFKYEDIIMQFPRISRNREDVERLRNKPHRLTEINFVARKYQLTLQETCRLLDEDDIFRENGELDFDVFQHKANMLFRQSRKREAARDMALHRMLGDDAQGDNELVEDRAVDKAYFLDVPAMLQKDCNIEQYNMFLLHRSHIELLERFFPGKVPDHILNTFERIDLQYRLNEEVINVLIHYLKTAELSWSRAYIESIAADMLGRGIATYEQAVEYVRMHTSVQERRSKSAGGRTGTGSRSKGSTAGKSSRGANSRARPAIDVYHADQDREASTISDEEYAELLRKAERLKEL